MGYMASGNEVCCIVAPFHFSDVTLVLVYVNALHLQMFLHEIIVRPSHLGKGIRRCAYVCIGSAGH